MHTPPMQTANGQHTDILVVGAGMVGAAAALGLAQQGYRVAVVEPNFQQQVDVSAGYDLRISAVTEDNIELLRQLGVWEDIQALRVQAFEQLSVRKQGSDWLTLGQAGSQLGYMIENSVLQHGLYLGLQRQPNIELYTTTLQALQTRPEHQGYAQLANGQALHFDWVLGCDGAQSQVRQASGIGVAGREYGQRCLLSVVTCSAPVAARTWESFAEHGEIHALLPLADSYACLIAYGSRPQVQQWQANDESLRRYLTSQFADITGDFEVQQAGAFDLTRQSALQYVKGRTILLGDAAHTIHPMAGQGVNLGFRDVRQLLQASQGLRLKDGPGSHAVSLALATYSTKRRADNELMAQAMDSIGAGFGVDKGPIATVRELLLSGLRRFTPAQQLMTAYASGVWKVTGKSTQ